MKSKKHDPSIGPPNCNFWQDTALGRKILHKRVWPCLFEYHLHTVKVIYLHIQFTTQVIYLFAKIM